MKMNTLTKSIAIICAVGFLSSASVWAAPGGGGGGGGGGQTSEVPATCTDIPGGVNISWPDPDGKGHVYSYDVTLNHVGNTWTYTVNTIGNKALSHWLLEILNDVPPQCEGHIESTSGPTGGGATIGPDGSTGHEGVKWNTPPEGTFTIVMDDNYQTGLVDVLAKSATYYGVCQIKGPNCPYDLENGDASVAGFE